MASSRHAGPAGPCLFGRCASARHQGERTSTSRQTCCPLRFPRYAGSSGVSSGQGRPTPVASSLGRTGDDDTSSAPDDHTGPAEPELINPGCSTKGGVGDDSIDGGPDDDQLWGGPGNDQFLFKSVSAANGDQIMDFAQGDIIDLSAIDA